MRAERHPREAARLDALREYGVLDTPREAEFDDIVALASRICETPVALVSLVDAERQWFKAAVGTEIEEMPYDASVCAHAILHGGVVEFPDLTKDARFLDNPIVVGDPHARFYAGVSLETPEGLPLGTLCVLDMKPRVLTDLQRDALRVLGRQAMVQMELHRQIAAAETSRLEVEETLARAKIGTWRYDVATATVAGNPRAERFYNVVGAVPMAQVRQAVHDDDRDAVAAAHTAALRTGERYETEYRATGADGIERWLLARGDAEVDAEGSVIALRGVVIDVTERRRAEVELATSRSQLDDTLDLARVASWAWDAGSDRVRSNPLLRRFFGIPDVEEADIPLFHFLRSIHPEDRERAAVAIGAAIETREPYEMEYRVVDAEENVRWVLARGHTIPGTNTLAGVLIDVTALREAETERERLFAQVELERARLEQMFSESPAFIAVLYGPDLVFGYANAPYYTLVGHREIIGKPLAEALPEVVAQGFPEPLQNVMATGRPWSTDEMPCLLQREPDGPMETRYLALKYLPVYETDGTVSGVYSHGIDVTDAVQGREALAAERQEFRRLLDEVPAHVVTLRGDDLRYEFANRAFLGFVGRDDFLGKTAKEAWPVPDDHLAMLRGILATGEPVTGSEILVPAPSGGAGYFDFLFQPLREPDGTVSGVFVHSLDVSEKVRSREAMRQSEERFRMVAQATRDAVWDWDLRDDSIWWNEGITEMFGHKDYEPTAAWWMGHIHPEDRERVVAGIHAAIDEGRANWSDEYRYLRADGRAVIVEDRGFAVFDAEGRPVRMVGAMVDVTEQRTAQRRLEQTVADRTSELRAAMEEAERFNYSISHDLRTPLRAINATSQMLIEEAGPELGEYHRELLDRQAFNARRLGLLIDQLLRLSRLGMVEMARSPLDMTGIANAVTEEIGLAETSSKCRIEVQEGMSAEGDPALVRLVFGNLLENACKFSRGQGTVRVRQEGAVFSVSDEGVGFDMKYAKKLFLPFERLVQDGEFPGTGIGLANVDRIIRRHGGRVWAESEPGKGATFRFRLGPEN